MHQAQAWKSILIPTEPNKSKLPSDPRTLISTAWTSNTTLHYEDSKEPREMDWLLQAMMEDALTQTGEAQYR